MNSILIKEDYNHETYVYCDKGSDSFFYNSLNYSLTKSFNNIFSDENEPKYKTEEIKSCE